MTTLIGTDHERAVRQPSWWERQGELIMRRPFNEWTFAHMNRLLPSEPVPAGPVSRPLPERPHPLPVTYEFEGAEHTLAELHTRTYTTAFVVLYQGAVVHESYPGAFTSRRSRFQLFSLTKSVTSMLFGIALADGEIKSVDDKVTDYRPDFLGTGYDGPTLGDLLDMSSGVGDLESWDAPQSDIKRFERAILGGGSVEEVVRSARRTTSSGQAFNYSTLDAQVLGWVIEAATGKSLARYAADRLWSRIGAERPAYYWLTRAKPRTAIGGGSLCATARDLARLGLLMARDGMLAGEQIVPSEWVHRSRGSAEPHLAVGALGPSGYDHYGYANLWWTLGGPHQAFTGLGVHGQYLFVDPAADVVIVKYSAWPTQDDPSRDRETITALQRVAQYLSR
jgi:CubicO group peptidase (beta-lactamase class C family)